MVRASDLTRIDGTAKARWKSIPLAVHERPLPVRSVAGLVHLLGPTRSSRMISTNSANNSKPPATRRHINRLHIGTTFRCPQKTDGGRRVWIRRRECYQGKGLLRGSDRASSDLVANRDQKIPGALFQKTRRRPRRGFSLTGRRTENELEYRLRPLKYFRPSTCPCSCEQGYRLSVGSDDHPHCPRFAPDRPVSLVQQPGAGPQAAWNSFARQGRSAAS
jgi:hypothetical protein